MKHANLEERFLQPNNWQKFDIQNPETNHTIHFEHNISLDENKPLIIILPGLSEFCEKYYETANYFIKHSYDCLTIDWAYQGRSTRLNKSSHKRHSDGYETDISDLKYIIDHYTNQNAPLLMLGHSMGGHIGLRFLSQYPDYFQAASFSAPMLGIKDLKYSSWLIPLLSPVFKLFGKSYIPGGKDWREEARKSDGSDIFSSEPARDALHNTWCLYNPILQIGNPTIKWVLESLKSISILKKNYQNIRTPTLLAIAECEEIVCNASILKASKKIPNSKLLNLKNAKHEILMETDDIQDQFLNETLKMFKQST